MKTIRILPSKSDAHRALICAALSASPCEIVCEETSRDIEATRACLAALTGPAAGTDEPAPESDEPAVLPCGESGSTFRFLLPVCGALGRRTAFLPEGRLPARPLSPLYEELTAHGMRLSPQGEVPFRTEGQLVPGTYTIRGDVSSQFISGLLFALPLLPGDSRILVPGQLESAGYVDMTRRTQARFGVRTEVRETPEGLEFLVPGGQTYQAPPVYQVEGDWSNAAFWLAAGVLGEEPVRVTGLAADSAQGDRAIVPILQQLGARIETEEDAELPKLCAVTAYPSREKLRGTEIDARPIPDLVPILASVAALAKGETRIKNAGRLRLKESDRLKTTAALIRALGGDAEERPDGLVLRERESLRGGEADGAGDHRIVMSAAILSLATEGPVRLQGSSAAAKSYPGFFGKMEALGLAGNLIRRPETL